MPEKKTNNKKWSTCEFCQGRIYEHRKMSHECDPEKVALVEARKKGLYKRGVGSPLNKPSIAQEIASKTPMPKKKRVLLKLKETKLGVTLVLSLEDCKTLGFTGEEMTREVVDEVRKKLGLPVRKSRK